jgi:hypothetical protein
LVVAGAAHGRHGAFDVLQHVGSGGRIGEQARRARDGKPFRPEPVELGEPRGNGGRQCVAPLHTVAERGRQQKQGCKAARRSQREARRDQRAERVTGNDAARYVELVEQAAHGGRVVGRVRPVGGHQRRGAVAGSVPGEYGMASVERLHERSKGGCVAADPVQQHDRHATGAGTRQIREAAAKAL